VVNTEALNSLSASNKKALLGSVDEAIAFYVDSYDNKTTGKYEQAVTDQGLTRVTFTADQTAELNKLAASVREDWVKKYSSKFDAKTLFDFTEKLFNN
jgi:TRAP-type C4-dicarboxylate transport system substrate-binding protein